MKRKNSRQRRRRRVPRILAASSKVLGGFSFVPTAEVARTVGTGAGVLSGINAGTGLYDKFVRKSDIQKAREESDRARRRRKQWQGESVFRQISDQLRGMFTQDDDIYAYLKKAEQRERESKQAKLKELKRFQEEISQQQKRLKDEERKVQEFAGIKSSPRTATTATATQTSTRFSPSKNDTLSRIQNLRNRILQSRSPTRMLTDRDRDRAMIETRRKSPPMMSSSRMLMDRDRDRRDRRDRDRDRAMIETRRKSPPMMSSSRMLMDRDRDRDRDRAMIETRRKSPPMMSSSSSRPQSPVCEEICFSRCEKRRSPERRVRFSDDA